MRIGPTSSHAGRSNVGVDARIVVSPPPILPRDRWASGSTSAPLPPAAGGVREDDDEDRNNVRDGVRKDNGSGRRHRTRDDRLLEDNIAD